MKLENSFELLGSLVNEEVCCICINCAQHCNKKKVYLIKNNSFTNSATNDFPNKYTDPH